jgi:Mg-chelatase subunit ChlD
VRWYGCAASRDYPLDVTDGQWDTRVPGAMNVSCGAPGMELTNDDAALRQRIDDITTFGNTYIPAGLFWGWTVLSPQEPFATAKGYGEKVDGATVEKVMVLMTDGANTRSPNYITKNHAGSDVALANARTAELCTNIKAAGIKIYTVAFDVDEEDVKDMLRACASSDRQFYDAEDATELETAFANIGANLSPLRIAR